MRHQCAEVWDGIGCHRQIRQGRLVCLEFPLQSAGQGALHGTTTTGILGRIMMIRQCSLLDKGLNLSKQPSRFSAQVNGVARSTAQPRVAGIVEWREMLLRQRVAVPVHGTAGRRQQPHTHGQAGCLLHGMVGAVVVVVIAITTSPTNDESNAFPADSLQRVQAGAEPGAFFGLHLLLLLLLLLRLWIRALLGKRRRRWWRRGSTDGGGGAHDSGYWNRVARTYCCTVLAMGGRPKTLNQRLWFPSRLLELLFVTKISRSLKLGRLSPMELPVNNKVVYNYWK